MASLPTKAPTFESTLPKHEEPKPKAIPPAPDTAPKAPPVSAKPKTPRDGVRPQGNPGAVLYDSSTKTGSRMVRASRILARKG